MLSKFKNGLSKRAMVKSKHDNDQQRWVCSCCDNLNEYSSLFCYHCHCPAQVSRDELEQWKKGRKNNPLLPSFRDYLFWGEISLWWDNVGRCPGCGLSMYVVDSRCPHCGYELLDNEKVKLITEHDNSKNRSIFYGIIFFPLLLIVLYLIFE